NPLRGSGENSGDIHDVPACPAGIHAYHEGEPKDAIQDVPGHATQHIAVFEVEVLGIVPALSTPITPAHLQILTFAAPGAVIEHRLRRVDDAMTRLEQAESKVVVIG